MCECRRITLRQVREWTWDMEQSSMVQQSSRLHLERCAAWGRLSDYTDCDLVTYAANILVILFIFIRFGLSDFLLEFVCLIAIVVVVWCTANT